MIKKLFFWALGLAIAAAVIGAAGMAFWARQPITPAGSTPVDFTVLPGSGVRSAGEQIAAAHIPMDPLLFEAVARFTGKSSRLKAGSYTLKPGTTPMHLIDQLVRGEFAQESLAIIEGWTFRQMRQAIAAHPSLLHDTSAWTDQALLARLAPDLVAAEGMFFPDTYRFARHSSDLQVYRQALALMQKKLDAAWQLRAPDLPYKSPYEALIMASIVEKETGQKADRPLIASVFVNRLKRGMLLQTDPTVIYGMGPRYQGRIHKRDLAADTPFNTYLRSGLPPTPIALPGEASIKAALNPVPSNALYFVARGNGESAFSDNLTDHNRAVQRFLRGAAKP